MGCQGVSDVRSRKFFFLDNGGVLLLLQGPWERNHVERLCQ